MDKYQEQMKRVERYYNRFKKVSDAKQDIVISKETEDDIYAFFQNCYHLKDYLKNDTAYTKHSDRDIEDYINNTFELKLCADICNGLKHLTLTNPRSGATPNFGKKIVKMTVFDPMGGSSDDTKITSKVEIKIDHGGNHYDAFDIATKALGAWRNFV